MRYLSTRGEALIAGSGRAGALSGAGFTDVLLEGLAPDGGLAVPAWYPRVHRDTLAGWRTLDYPALAAEILRLFCDDIDTADIGRLTRAAYRADVFGSAAIAPLVTLGDGLHLLQLSNGPSLAFKDMAMQLLGALFEYVLQRRGAHLNILGATSGDTGSAAEYALRGKQAVRVFMLSPDGRMSAFQRAQMYTLQDANIFNIAIDGTFDDCQDVVKAIAGDIAFKRRYALGAVNSINWGRIVAQVVYYVHGYLAATAGAGAGAGAQTAVAFAVPSGNFGNVLAGWIAKQIGVPIARLIVATNENDVLDEFFRTGRYRVRGAAETHATSSPSMDISKASNFERYVFDVVGRDPQIVRELWWQLDTAGGFDLTATPFWAAVQASGFVSGSSTHADRLATIRSVYQDGGRIVDPHTADGIKVAREHRLPGVPTICLETALPAKFGETVVEAIGRAPDRPAAFVGIEDRPQRVVRLPADAGRVKQFIEQHAAT